MAAVQHNFLTGLKEYALITAGVLCYALAWIIFLIPNNLVGGGVTGVASIVQYATGGVIKVSYCYFVINAILLIIGMSSLGKGFGAKTVYAVIAASLAFNFGGDLIPHEIIRSLALDNGKLMCVIMGGMLSGFGIGLTMSQGGSTGGTDIVALVLNKRRGISPGRMILWLDIVIIASSILVPSYKPDGTLMPFVDKIMVVVYGYILTAVVSITIDTTIAGSKQSVQLFITSKNYEAIAEEIANGFHRGVTVLNGKGWFSKEDAHVLMVLTRKVDLNPLLRSIKAIDPNAFISVSSVTGVYGRGFDAIKSGGKEGSKRGSKTPIKNQKS
jgi:uncharacterized membrane-anchored protein YitT (DUF2179 family)